MSSSADPLVGFQDEVLNICSIAKGYMFSNVFLFHLMKLTGSEKYLQEANTSRYGQQKQLHLHSKVGSAVLNASTFHDSDFP